MISIPKETPHMFMWFSDGRKIPAGRSPLPQNERLDYITRLKQECKKLLITKTPVYLVYMGRLLNDEQKKLLENLQNESPNLAVIDYDEVEAQITDESIKGQVEKYADSYKKNGILDVGVGGIADLVDFTRLVLLYYSDILRELAQRKIQVELEWAQGLIYRDFDVTLEAERMQDLPTTYGYMASLNFTENIRIEHEALIKSADGKEDLIQKIKIFFNKYLYNAKEYCKVLDLFLANPLTIEQKAYNEQLLSEYLELFGTRPALPFKERFIHPVFIENSFLALSGDRYELVSKMIRGVLDGDTPYAVVHRNLRGNFNKISMIKEFIRPQLIGFVIGNDYTWKLSVENQHTPVELSPAAAEIQVTKLSNLSKEYLTHLNKHPKKNNYQDKYNIVSKLNNILDSQIISAAEKLVQFKQGLQAADKQLLKAHRDPNWLFFKKVALFLLGLTGIGALVGVIDYAVRKHHSIFCATKSHGERFILDITEYLPQQR